MDNAILQYVQYGSIKAAERQCVKKKNESEWHACGLLAILSLYYKARTNCRYVEFQIWRAQTWFGELTLVSKM